MIKVGICLATMGARYADMRAATRRAEELGYESVWAWDHYVAQGDQRAPVPECWTTLAGLAEATSRVRLGPLVANIVNRHPGRLAKVAATLNELSGGRLDMGVGAGGWAGEQAPFGIDQGTRAERTARLAEALQIIPALWSGEPVTFHGQHYQLDGAIAAPAQDPLPRLIVGGRSPELAELAGRYAGGLNLQWHDREKFPAALAALDAALAAGGRTRAGFDLSLHATWADLGPDPRARLAEWAALGFTRVMLLLKPPFALDALDELAGWAV